MEDIVQRRAVDMIAAANKPEKMPQNHILLRRQQQHHMPTCKLMSHSRPDMEQVYLSTGMRAPQMPCTCRHEQYESPAAATRPRFFRTLCLPAFASLLCFHGFIIWSAQMGLHILLLLQNPAGPAAYLHLAVHAVVIAVCCKTTAG
jgi:hypothetical protein